MVEEVYDKEEELLEMDRDEKEKNEKDELNEEEIVEELMKGKEQEELEEPKEVTKDEKDKKITELLSKLQYLQAEYENYKKRTARDFESIIDYSKGGLVQNLLPIIDDFEASLKSIGDEKIFEGFKLLYNNFMKTLGDEGLEEIKALGESFDPFKHEAVSEVNDPERNENEIFEVVQKGYMFKSKVIRPSKVKVVKHQPEEEKAEEKGEENKKEGESDG